VATHRIHLIGSQVTVDGGGRIVVEPFDVTPNTTNDVWKHKVVRFKNNDGVAKDVIFGKFGIPKNYVDTANLIVVWSTNLTTLDVVWDFDYRAVGGNDIESLDQSGFQESVTGTDDSPSAAWERLELSIALTDTNFAADDTVQYQFGLDGLDAAHTFTGNAVLFGLYFEYNDA